MDISLINQLITQAYEYSERRFIIYKEKESKFFSELNLIKEISTLPFLLPLIFSKNIRLARAVAVTIHGILLETPVDQFDSFDSMMREADSRHPISAQNKVSIIKSLNLENIISNSMYALLSFYRCGYDREQAIKELLPVYSELYIPILIIRANDWVENIKTLASSKLIEHLYSNNINEFLPSLSLIYNLYKKSRYNHTLLISTIENKLIESCYNNLLEIVTHSNGNLSRVAFKVAAQEVSKLHQLIEAAIKTSDLTIKLDTLKLLTQHFNDDTVFKFLCNLLTDNSSIVRRKCIFIIAERFTNKSSPLLKIMLFDKSPIIRESARYYLKRNGINKIDKIYQETLISKSKPIDLSIVGLAETGNEENYCLIEPYINDNALNIRSACIYATFQLKPKNKQELILSQLPSKEPKILKTIYAGLIQYSDDYDLDEIEKKFCGYGDCYSEKLFIKMRLSIIKDRLCLINFILEAIIKTQNNDLRLFLEYKITTWLAYNSFASNFKKPDKKVLDGLLLKIDKLIFRNVSLYNKLKEKITIYFL